VMDRKKMQELLALVSLQQQETGQDHSDEYRGGVAPAVSWMVKAAGSSTKTSGALGAGAATTAGAGVGAGSKAGNGSSSVRGSGGGANASTAPGSGGASGQASQMPQPTLPSASASSSSLGDHKALAGQLVAVEKQFADYQAATRERVGGTCLKKNSFRTE
jgi:hypothetical protein